MITEDQIQELINSDEHYQRQYFVWQGNHDNIDIHKFFIDILLPNLEEPVVALMQHTGDSYDDAERAISLNEWLVLTDEEAEEYCRQYTSDALDRALYDVDKSLHHYFDADRYIEDYLDSGRGAILAGYDGNEYEETVNGTTYYLYRT